MSTKSHRSIYRFSMAIKIGWTEKVINIAILIDDYLSMIFDILKEVIQCKISSGMSNYI